MPPKRIRISDRIDSMIIAAQVLFATRLLILISGYSSQAFFSWLLRPTDPLAHALYTFLPPIEIGRYIIEPASAALMVGFSALFALISFVIDQWRLAQKEQGRQPTAIESY